VAYVVSVHQDKMKYKKETVQQMFFVVRLAQLILKNKNENWGHRELFQCQHHTINQSRQLANTAIVCIN